YITLTSLQDPPPHAPYSPFILVSNLRAHLYVALEKNVWMQKRIEELEEERNYLRCQLDRFIISMRSPTEQGMDLFRRSEVWICFLDLLKDEEDDSSVETKKKVKDPDGVLIRYKKILSTYQRVRSMSRAFQIHGVDRNTMASTSPIAELLLVAPEKVADVGEFDPSKEKLLDYARRCYKTMDEQTHAKVQSMKKTHKLLPISYRFRN
uniref:Coiled-coil domain containing 106b n=1 Tax=Sphaeramia orbicularis TaxID=375764 RepID=A0A673AXY3_9TELE